MLSILLLLAASDAVLPTVDIKDDPFSKYIRACAPEHVVPGSKSYTTTRISVCALKMRDGSEPPSFWISFYNSYEGESWRFYNGVYRLGGKMMKADFDTDLGGCSAYDGCLHFESAVIDMDADDRAACQKEGLSLKITGRVDVISSVPAVDCQAVENWVAAQ